MGPHDNALRLLLEAQAERERREREVPLDALFAALASPARRTALDLLVFGATTAGDLTASLQDLYGISRSRASQHLNALARSRLTWVSADGARRVYGIEDRAVDAGLAWLTHLALPQRPLAH